MRQEFMKRTLFVKKRLRISREDFIKLDTLCEIHLYMCKKIMGEKFE